VLVSATDSARKLSRCNGRDEIRKPGFQRAACTTRTSTTEVLDARIRTTIGVAEYHHLNEGEATTAVMPAMADFTAALRKVEVNVGEFDDAAVP